MKVDISKDTDSMAETPRALLLEECSTGEPPKATAIMEDNTDWQTLLLDYTPQQDEDLSLVVQCKNNGGNVWFNYRVEDITGRPQSLGLGI